MLARLAGLTVLTVLGAGCRGRPRAWEQSVDGEGIHDTGAAVLEIDLTAGAPEQVKGGLLSLPSRNSFDTLVAALHQAETRKDVKGILISFGTAGIGWARAHELGDALGRLRAKKVPITCHADAWENTAYSAAVRGCDTIAMSPGGEVELTGPAATVPFANSLLEKKLHAQVDILQVGKFKGAAEPLTRDGPSPEYRQSIENALGAVRASYAKALSTRGLEGEVGGGPFMAEEARAKKIVDVLVDRKGAREQIKHAAGDVPVDLIFGPGADGGQRVGLLDVLRNLGQGRGDAQSRPHVRLLRLHGEIVLGGESGMFGGPAGIVARKLVERAHELAKDDSVKAVVLRIDSPGGSALGSDLAWIALKELRDKKPVVVSIGEMAASGGYYLSTSGARIWAEPESIVGSIGVVGGKISFGGTLDELGVHTATFGDKRAAQLGSITEPWDDETRQRLLAGMTEIYDLFLRRVAEGRGRKREDFTDAVEGRVFGGEQAKGLGLVDEIGGLGDALTDAKQRAGLPAGAPVVVDEAGGLLEAIGGEDEAMAALGMALPAGTPPELLALRGWVVAFVRATRGTGVAAMMPAPLMVR
jgi:protease-4